jgi:hypothetical protein
MRAYFKGTGTAFGKEYNLEFGYVPKFKVIGAEINIKVTVLNLSFGLSGDLSIGFGEPEPESR